MTARTAVLKWVPALSLLAATFSGCFPEPLTEVGKRCSGERQCTPPLVCEQGRCADRSNGGLDGGADGGLPLNLLANPGFEDGAPPAGWRGSLNAILVADTSAPRSGSQALRASFSTAAGYVEPIIAPVPAAFIGRTYCASLFFRGYGRPVALGLVEGGGGGPLETVTAGSPPVGVWQEVRVGRVATTTLALTVQAMSGGASTGDLMVDDGYLWTSAAGTCAER